MIEVNYERRGSGTPLVLLHGLGHRWQAWLPVMDRLAERHDVIAMDLPGCGRSGPLPVRTGLDHASSVTIIGDVLAQLGVVGAHVAGNSLGGLLALEAAAQGLVASATAFSPAGFCGVRERAATVGALHLLWAWTRPPGLTALGLSSQPVRTAALRFLYAHPERIDRETALGDLTALRGSSAFSACIRAGWWYSWQGPEPAVPLTVAWAELDRILPVRQAKRAAALLPNAHHVTLPGCGHIPMIDDPQLVAQTILDTCARADAANPAA